MIPIALLQLLLLLALGFPLDSPRKRGGRGSKRGVRDRERARGTARLLWKLLELEEEPPEAKRTD